MIKSIAGTKHRLYGIDEAGTLHCMWFVGDLAVEWVTPTEWEKRSEKQWDAIWNKVTDKVKETREVAQAKKPWYKRI